MTPERITDRDGDAWPVTGHWCRKCGMPLIVVTPDQTTHPTCQPERDTP